MEVALKRVILRLLRKTQLQPRPPLGRDGIIEPSASALDVIEVDFMPMRFAKLFALLYVMGVGTGKMKESPVEAT